MILQVQVPSNLNLDSSTDTGVSTTDNLTNSNTSLSTIDDVRETDFICLLQRCKWGYNQVGTEVLVPNNINGSIDDTKTTYIPVSPSGLNLSDSTYQMFLISKDGFGNLSNATVS